MNRDTASNSKRVNWLASLSSDGPASVVVFLVALPLCMGIAIASGVPPVAGLITGIIGGLVVGWISGSPLQVSGPAAGLAVVVFDLVQRHRGQYLERFGAEATEEQAMLYAWSMLGIVVFVAGVTQLLAGVLKLGQWFRAVSPAVVQGMLAGIGALIFVNQFHVMVHDKPREGGLANLLALPEAVMKGLLPLNDTSVHHYAACIGIVTIVTIVAWSFAPRRLKVLPAPLVAVTLATILTAVFGLQIDKVSLPENIFAQISLPAASAWSHALDIQIILAGLAMALIASAETLLCATAVDQLHQGPRTRYDRELSSQGIGNMLCGLLGGLPMTGVIVRSSANVYAGAKSRTSAILHGLWLLLFVALLPGVLQMIPIASLAAVLVYTGYKLINPKAVKKLWQYGKMEVVIYAVTLTVIVVEDLLMGVMAGIALSIAKLLYTFSHLDVWIEHDGQQARPVMHLKGAATFVRLPKLAQALEQIEPHAELHVQIDQLAYIDHACLDLLMNWERQHEATGGRLVIDWDGLHARFRRSDNRLSHEATRDNGHRDLASQAEGNGHAHHGAKASRNGSSMQPEAAMHD
jgi:MFS superfamily sulfate permease-like transporter